MMSANPFDRKRVIFARSTEFSHSDLITALITLRNDERYIVECLRKRLKRLVIRAI